MNPVFLSSIVALGVLGLTFGAILAIASRKFAIEVDPRIEELTEILPGANCGGCGYPGCAGYGEAVVTKGESITLCGPGGPETAGNIAQILGVEAQEMVPKIAVVQCGGSHNNARQKYEYDGIKDCNVATLLGGGSKACEFGCLGLGSCVEACPYDAMAMRDDGLPMVFEDKCTGCGLCVTACPKGIMELITATQKVYVACVSHLRAKEVKAVCSVGCTGCGLCANPKFTPSGVVTMNREINLPIIPGKWDDYETAVEKCPTQCFVVREM
ncbi:MAG TPA: RnfABCDGE type electron transport complex subunit B [Bacteroidetes bacterium]|nr:RnfABCDGE type electron transport complex subunit B [Bacteroidota bacterium]